MNDTPSDEPALPASLVFLRRLVTVLTLVMIGGVVVVIALLIARLQPAPPPMPDEISLPDGVNAVSVTVTDGWYGVATDQDTFLVFDRLTGELRQTVVIETEGEE